MPMYDIGQVISIDKDNVGSCYQCYKEIFEIYEIPNKGFVYGRSLHDFDHLLYTIKHIVPHPTSNIPLYIISSEDEKVTFIVEQAAIKRVVYNNKKVYDYTYENLSSLSRYAGELRRDYRKALERINQLEKELNYYKPDPMPELKSGMIGKTHDIFDESYHYFVVVPSEDDKIIMVYEDGDFDECNCESGRNGYNKYGEIYDFNDNKTSEIITLYSSKVKSFNQAKYDIHTDEDFLWNK